MLFRRPLLSVTAFLLAAYAIQGAGIDGEDRRQAAVADFTRKTQAANFPALFEQSAREFGVPADILKGIAFAETRWEHLSWPPGETVSPETGMPRPYGVMSLWDNNYFGHSLIEAANLIGKSPEELKADPLQNIRGAAALLRKLYDETPKPDSTSEGSLESWRNAIRKYCGIPEPDLNALHALKVYTFMSQGYHEYGIEWDSVAVDLKPIQEQTEAIIQLEQQKRTAPGARARAQLEHPLAAATNLPPQSQSRITVLGVGHERAPKWRLTAGLAIMVALVIPLFWVVKKLRREPPHRQHLKAR